MLTDREESVMVWICALTFCILCWVQVYKVIVRQFEKKEMFRQEIERLETKLEGSSKIYIDGKEIRYDATTEK